MEHRKEFRGEKLAQIFPGLMHYYFEKIFSAIYSPSDGNRKMGEGCLNLLSTAFNDFKVALEKRGALNESSSLPHEIKEAEYPLLEIHQYFNGGGLLKDPRAAAIFAHFLRHKMQELLKIASEIDEEYEGDVAEKVGEQGGEFPFTIVITDIHGNPIVPMHIREKEN
jgi:hypothetical protein